MASFTALWIVGHHSGQDKKIYKNNENFTACTHSSINTTYPNAWISFSLSSCICLLFNLPAGMILHLKC